MSVPILLGDLLNNLAGSAATTGPHRIGKHLAGRPLHHLPGHGDAIAVAAADPADEDRVGTSNAIFAHLLALLADGREAFAVGLAGLLLQKLVDGLLLCSGRLKSVIVI